MHTNDLKISAKDRFFLVNVFGVSAVEFLWGLGLPVVVDSTFLQLFLTKLGASSFGIGLIPTFFFIGCSVFALVSSYVTAPLSTKKNAVVILHLIPAVSLLFFSIALFRLKGSSYLLTIFFICYGIFSICIGMTLPVWLNYLVNIFSTRKSVAGLGYMNLSQNIGKLVSSLIILKVVDAYAFSLHSAAVIFLVVGALFATGAFFFLFTKEFPSQDKLPTPPTRSFGRYTVQSIVHMVKNRNILWFLLADLEFFAVTAVISFYAKYATIFCHINPAVAAGLFVACIFLGAIASNLILGSWGLLSLKQKSLVSKIMAVAAIALLIISGAQWSFLLASFLLGASRGTRMIVMPPVVKQLSGLADTSSYFALGSIITLPVAVGLPMLAGYFLDFADHLGATAYQLVFGASALFVLLTVFFLQKVDFNAKI